MNNIETILNKLMVYFNVLTIKELAETIGISQQAISKWKAKNSINAIKKRCRELEIYNDIFDDLSFKSQYIGHITNSNISQNKIQNQQIKEVCNTFTDEIIEIDKASFSLYKEAYLKAKENGKIKEFRLYLMDFNI